MSNMPDEIDQIMAEAAAKADGHSLSVGDYRIIAEGIRTALKAAGYVIQLDEAALLKRGEEAGITLKEKK